MLENSTPILQKLAYGNTLSTEEIKQALDIISDEDTIPDKENSNGFYFLALTFGLMAKGPTADELLGFVESIRDRSIKLETTIPASNIIDISGTGGDLIKTINVGTISSFVLAAGGLAVAKQATRGYTGYTGSADLYTQIGLNPFSVDSGNAVKSLEELGLSAFYTPGLTDKFKNRMDFLVKLKTIGLSYPTPWHLISWVYSPFTMENRIYGVFDPKYGLILTRLFEKMDYRRVLVIHGLDGLDEFSNVGETYVAELKDGKIREYSVNPADFGLEQSPVEAILTLTKEEKARLDHPLTPAAEREQLREEGRKRNIRAFFEILNGQETGPLRDLVMMNCGAAFYISGKAASYREGTAMAREILESGRASAKLKELIRFANAEEKVEETMRKMVNG
ncbi:MAG: hypothetical protein SF052_23390 [Bacteroidia bacterium]|nr:hypothetical protein [Bacteroidia bacterium]